MLRPIQPIRRMLVPDGANDRADRYLRHTPAQPIVAGSCPGEATAANASGKLAPHKIVGGRIAQKQRARSNWK